MAEDYVAEHVIKNSMSEKVCTRVGVGKPTADSESGRGQIKHAIIATVGI